MSESTWKEKLTAALAEPPPPEKLVEDTVARVKITQAGRQAEKRLQEEADRLSAAERITLSAESVLGRLAGNGTLPLGADAGKLKQQLLGNPRFCQLAEKDPLRMLSGLKDGTLLKNVPHSGGTPREVSPREAAPREVTPREVTPRAKRGPAL